MSEGKDPIRKSKTATDASTGAPAGFGACQLALAWAAGFVDGEGCIHIAKQRYGGLRRETYRLGVYVSQNDRGVLESLCRAVGITAPIHAVKRAANHTKQCYSLNFTGKAATELLTLLMPYLRRKRLEAEAALQFWKQSRLTEDSGAKGVTPEIAERREHFYQLLKRLK